MARKRLRLYPCAETRLFQYGAPQEALSQPFTLVTSAFMLFRPKLRPRLCANKTAREKNWTQTLWFLWLLFSAASQIGVSHINLGPE